MKRCVLMLAAAAARPALAGPPYLNDDPQPTRAGHYETYFFVEGAQSPETRSGSTGIDFNYGAIENLQLTAVLPFGWDRSADGSSSRGFGNIELAAKYQFLHQRDAGVDVAFFPRVFLPAATSSIGEPHAALLLPLWIQRSWDGWSAFGGGGCEIHRGGDARDFCQFGLALTKQARQDLQVGAEIHHQTPDAAGSRASTDFNVGATYDIDPRLHLMGSIGTGLQNRAETDRTIWYAALLWTL